MKYTGGIILSFSLVCTLSVSGMKKDREAWILSEFVPPSALSNQLVKAETAAINSHFKEAVKHLNAALKLDDAVSKQYMTRINNDGPVSLQIEFARAYYMFKSPYYSNRDAASEAESTITTYAKQNRVNNWWSYRELYVLLKNHYNTAQDYLTMLKYSKARFELDPVNSIDYPQELYRYNQPEKMITDTLDYMKKRGCKLPPELTLIECKIDRAKGEDTYDRVMSMLLDNPAIWIQTFREGLHEARIQLDVKNPARIKDFYNTLRKLAMIQPPDQSGMERVQWCMQERTKLEGLVPEYLGTQPAE